MTAGASPSMSSWSSRFGSALRSVAPTWRWRSALTRLLHGDFVSHGTDGKGRHLDDENVPIVIKAHRAVLERLALEPPVWPFRTFEGPRGFGTYWCANGMRGSWQARRECIEQVLGPTRDALEELQELE
ncbi:hypothetical protein ACIG0D_31345 [Streptomyces sp. NPDC052773]|uniref:hypothetical protein n=1 Tax=Streptomyces sp. NPDC052773 TaxID=3365693 RepID=UPI0037CEA53E